MERPTVLLALQGYTTPYVDALSVAGFDVLTDLSIVIERMADGRGVDLAVLDCDLLDAATLYAELHGVTPVPTILVFADEPPVWATGNSSHTTRDEYALKPLPADALVYRLQALQIRYNRGARADAGQWDESATSEGATIGEGHVVSIFAPKGGVGKTTIAVNLAVALREQTRAQILLLDADVGVGNVTSVLDVPYRMGLADLADSSPEEWTDAAFDQAVCVHKASGVNVLTWGNDPAESERISVDLLLAAVRWARAHYSYVVIDNHPSYDDRTMAMLAISGEIFLVVTPEVGPLRNAAQFLEVAREVGLGDIVKVIVNRANHGVSMDDIAETLGKPVSAMIVSNGPKAVAAANEGTPMITKFPNERMSADLHGVARLLTREQTSRETEKTRPWWATLAARLSSV
ncbi:MAG: AAA family ATPase [Chloroflexota bacterium]|nr:AAA family ATPase [Chloroflexota bacterium]